MMRQIMVTAQAQWQPVDVRAAFAPV